MRDISGKGVQKIKSHILCTITFSLKSCLSWDNVQTYGKARNTTANNMAHACCMLDKAIRAHARAHAPAPAHPHSHTYTHAHTQIYTIFFAFTQQQWLLERTSMLRYMYTARLVLPYTSFSPPTLSYVVWMLVKATFSVYCKPVSNWENFGTSSWKKPFFIVSQETIWWCL
jgi:hypothetical protein